MPNLKAITIISASTIAISTTVVFAAPAGLSSNHPILIEDNLASSIVQKVQSTEQAQQRRAARERRQAERERRRQERAQRREQRRFRGGGSF